MSVYPAIKRWQSYVVSVKGKPDAFRAQELLREIVRQRRWHRRNWNREGPQGALFDNGDPLEMLSLSPYRRCGRDEDQPRMVMDFVRLHHDLAMQAGPSLR